MPAPAAKTGINERIRASHQPPDRRRGGQRDIGWGEQNPFAICRDSGKPELGGLQHLRACKVRVVDKGYAGQPGAGSFHFGAAEACDQDAGGNAGGQQRAKQKSGCRHSVDGEERLARAHTGGQSGGSHNSVCFHLESHDLSKTGYAVSDRDDTAQNRRLKLSG